MAHYSENEISFFNQLLYEYDIRIDGREKMEIRNHEIKQDIVTTCFSSLKMCYNNSKNEIFFAIKGELVPTSTINENNKVINLNIDSIQKSNENTKVKSQIENILNSMLIEKTPVDNLKVENSKPEMIWKIYVDVFVFDELKMSILQILAMGIRKVLMDVKLPKIVTFYNEITKANEYDLKANYEELAEKDMEYFANLTPPQIFTFSVMNNKLYLDPVNEEWDISNCVIFVSVLGNKILQIQSTGGNINPLIMLELENVIANLNTNE